MFSDFISKRSYLQNLTVMEKSMNGQGKVMENSWIFFVKSKNNSDKSQRFLKFAPYTRMFQKLSVKTVPESFRSHFKIKL